MINCDPLNSFCPPVFMRSYISGVRFGLGFAQGCKDSFFVLCLVSLANLHLIRVSLELVKSGKHAAVLEINIYI